MTLLNIGKKEEALKLRESGMKILDIVDKTGLSKATLKRVFKKAGLTSEKLSRSHNKSKTSEKKDEIEDKNVNEPIKSELGVLEVKDKEGTSVTQVTYDTKSGGLILGTGNTLTENPTVPEAGKSETLQPEKSEESFVEKPPLFEHKTLIPDSLKGDNLLYILLPVMVGAGLLMKGKLGEKGVFREEQNGGDW